MRLLSYIRKLLQDRDKYEVPVLHDSIRLGPGSRTRFWPKSIERKCMAKLWRLRCGVLSGAVFVAQVALSQVLAFSRGRKEEPFGTKQTCATFGGAWRMCVADVLWCRLRGGNLWREMVARRFVVQLARMDRSMARAYEGGRGRKNLSPHRSERQTFSFLKLWDSTASACFSPPCQPPPCL
jgi:hypothetical protein